MSQNILLGFCTIFDADLPRDLLDLVLREATLLPLERELMIRGRDLNFVTENILNSIAFISLFIVSLVIHLFKYYSDHHNYVSYDI